MFRTALALVATLALATPGRAQAPVAVPPVGEPVGALAAPPSVPALSSLVRDLDDDLRRLPSREAAIILGVAGGVSLVARPGDAPLTRKAAGTQALDTAFEAGEVVGGGAVQIGAAIAAYAVGRAAGNPRVAVVGADLIRGQIVNSVLTQGLKLAVHRRRPDEGRFSFPSGHSSASFTTATILQRHLGWRVGVPAYGLAAYVAASRLQENRHYLSDVVFGAAVGIVSGRAVTVGRGRSRFAVAPFAGTGRVGIGFTRVETQ